MYIYNGNVTMVQVTFTNNIAVRSVHCKVHAPCAHGTAGGERLTPVPVHICCVCGWPRRRAGCGGLAVGLAAVLAARACAAQPATRVCASHAVVRVVREECVGAGV